MKTRNRVILWWGRAMTVGVLVVGSVFAGSSAANAWYGCPWLKAKYKLTVVQWPDGRDWLMNNDYLWLKRYMADRPVLMGRINRLEATGPRKCLYRKTPTWVDVSMTR